MTEPTTHPPQAFTGDPHALAQRAWDLRDRDRAAARRLLQSLGASGDGLLGAHLQTVQSYVDWREGRLARSLEWATAAIQTYRALPDLAWLPRALNVRGCVHGELGDYAQGIQALEEQIEVSRQIGDPDMEAIGLHDLGALHMARDPVRAEPYFQATRALLNQPGRPNSASDRALLTYLALNTGELRALHNDAGAARPLLLEAVERARSERLPFLEGTAKSIWGGMELRLGQLERAETLLREAYLQLSEEGQGASWEAVPPLIEVLTRSGQLERARDFLREQLEVATREQMRPLEVQLHASLAEVLEGLGDTAGALGHLRAHLALFRRVYAEEAEQKVRALEVQHRTQLIERDAELARQNNLELRAALDQLGRLHEQLEDVSLTDELTGVRNRRFLMTRGAAILGAASAARPAALAVVDLDHFKAVNDSLGHDGGDQVLREFAALLQGELRAHDVVVRFGGEEFVALLPDTPLDRAAEALERVRAALRTRPWTSAPLRAPLTFTAGVTACPGDDLLAALRRADQLMYAGKNAGRNVIQS